MNLVSLRVLLMSVALIGCSRTAPLRSPQALQANPDMATTEVAIGEALSSRGWAIQSRRPGVISALLAIRSHKLWVNIHYDRQRVQVVFAGSENLRESREGAAVYIHARVNKWLQNLNHDLAISLQQTQFAPARAEPPRPSGGY